MKRFFQENWIWILAPFLLMGVVVLIGLLKSGDGAAPFEYALF